MPAQCARAAFLCYTVVMSRRRFFLRYAPPLAALALLPSAARAQLQVGVGTALSFWQVLGNISAFLAGAIVLFSSAMFVVGAVLVMASGVKEDLRQRGKDFIVGSVLGIIVVLGSYALYRTVNCFLTPGCF